MENSENKGTKRSSGSLGTLVSIIFLSLVSILALTLCIAIMLRNAKLTRENEAYESELSALNEEGYYTTSQAEDMVKDATLTAEQETREGILSGVREDLENGVGTAQMIRNLFTEDLVVTHNGKYYFYPILDYITHHNFSENDFALNNGIMQYVGTDTENVSGELGIDVSRFNGDIDWEKVAKAGVKFAYIRVGSRGTTEGKLLEDNKFEDNIQGALENGIECGVYFYSQAVDDIEAKEEAQLVLDAIEPYEIKLPVVFDIETADTDGARTETVTQAEFTDIARTFCDMVKNAGYTPMIYGNTKTFTMLLDITQLQDIDTWIAYYNLPQYYPYEFSVWQYSSSGQIDGIDGDVDLNIAIKDFTKD